MLLSEYNNYFSYEMKTTKSKVPLPEAISLKNVWENNEIS